MSSEHAPRPIASLPRVIDVPDDSSITTLLVDHARETPGRVLFREKVDGEWVDRDAAWSLARVEALAKGLVASGVGAGDSVAIMCRTRLEWTLLDLAAWYVGAVPVPIYESSASDQAQWIVNDAAVTVAFAETGANAEVLREAGTLEGGTPTLREVLVIDDGALEELTTRGADVTDEQVRERQRAVRLADLATIIYTSGTTGRPKGAELTHENFAVLAVESVHDLHEVVAQPGSCTLLFIPLAHVFARFVEVLILAAGVPLGHAPDPKEAVADLAVFRPTLLLSVPRIWEKVYNSAEQKAGSGIKLKLFRAAAQAAEQYSRALDTPSGPSALLKARYRVLDRLVLGKLRDVMGGRLKYAVSGGAPLGERLGHFYRGVGLVVLEGYGLTETTAPIAVCRPDSLRIGTVGLPMPGTEIRIAEDSEIEVRGLPVFRGYRGGVGADAFTEDGFFRTGDLGSLDDGHLRITGRKKEIIVTAGGKNVVPALLEDPLRGHPLVSQCVVVGDKQPFIAALLTLDEEMLPGWLANHGRDPLTPEQARTDPFVRERLQQGIDRVNTKFSRAEQIKEFVILPEDLTVDNGYLTPSLKVKRSAVLADHADVVDSLYSDARTRRDNGGAGTSS
ncbi:AMP-dependent synthetase/ligase [Georgenia sp. Z1344]|uniref:AMP-dependent synthetase/ligase n=1 Tax=Georgenia sp. Z1344 TaxID=3416706 RepID=UPI003CF8A57D